MTDELKPCPFCGEKAIRCENFTGLAMFWTQCGSCHACPGGDHATREKADAAWNTRAAHYEGRRAVVGGDWVLVPREPTERMLHHGDKAQYGTSDGFLGRDIYRAMLAAAPSPPVAGRFDTDAFRGLFEPDRRGIIDEKAINEQTWKLVEAYEALLDEVSPPVADKPAHITVRSYSMPLADKPGADSDPLSLRFERMEDPTPPTGDGATGQRDCGSRDEPAVGATAALAPLVQAWFDRWGLSDVDTPDARELRAMLSKAQNFNVFPGTEWASLSAEDRVSGVLVALKSLTQPIEFDDDL